MKTLPTLAPLRSANGIEPIQGFQPRENVDAHFRAIILRPKSGDFLPSNIDVVVFLTGVPFLGIRSLDLVFSFECPPTVGAVGDPFHELMW